MIQKTTQDNVLFFVFLLLIFFGLAVISSAGIIYSQTRFEEPYYFFKHQLFFGVLPGMVIFHFFRVIDYHRWRKLAVPFFLLSIVFLILVFVPGIGMRTYGANRWVQLGPISFQSSEMAKLAIIFYLSTWLESRGTKKIKDFFEGLLPFLIIFSIVGFLIMKQPDIGTMGVVAIITVSIFFASGAKLSHLFSVGALGALLLYFLVKTETYRFNRLLIFLNPDIDPQGIGYHINQALLAIGSGGIFGLGLGHSRQKFNYLPEPVGDSIFAIIGEEMGLVGAVTVVVLFAIFAYRGFRIAKKAPDNFGKLLAVGITAWVVFQAMINIAAIMSLIPLTGIPLPFISYGGTSLIFLMAASGILMNISKQAKI